MLIVLHVAVKAAWLCCTTIVVDMSSLLVELPCRHQARLINLNSLQGLALRAKDHDFPGHLLAESLDLGSLFFSDCKKCHTGTPRVFMTL